MTNPNIDRKATGDNIPFHYDWKEELAKFGDNVISESHWTVDAGTITIGSDGRVSTIAGTVTTCYIQGGTAGETAVLNNSILCNLVEDPDSGNKLVRRFGVLITDGAYEPGTPPIVILPDGIPNLTDLAAFRGATPGVTVWVDTTPTYPSGTLYVAVPQHTFTPDGNLIVDGQLIQWVEIHVADGGTGVPIARRINTTAPLHGGGDLSADRTLSIDEVGATTSGVVPSLAGLDGPAVLATQNDSTTTWVGAGLSRYLCLTIGPGGTVDWNPLNANYFDMSETPETVMLTHDGNQAVFAFIKNANFDPAAAIAATKLALGGANQVLGSNGTNNAWTGTPTVTTLTTTSNVVVGTVLNFSSANTNPQIWQFATTSAGAAKDLGIFAQSNSGSGTGGNLVLKSGTGGGGAGIVALYAGATNVLAGTASSVTLLAGANAFLTGLTSSVTLAVGGTPFVSGTASNVSLSVGGNVWASAYAGSLTFSTNGAQAFSSTGSNTTLSAGGNTFISGFASSVSLSAGGNTGLVLLSTELDQRVPHNSLYVQDGNGYRTFEYVARGAVPLSYGVNLDLPKVNGVDWGGRGTLNASVTLANALVELEIEHLTSGGSSYQQVWKGHINANRLTSSDWGINYALALVSTDPVGSGGSVTPTMALSGVQNADLTITLAPGNVNVNYSTLAYKIRIFGSMRV